jgi:RimJ/RimL family protein N-acetyltransferase
MIKIALPADVLLYFRLMITALEQEKKTISEISPIVTLTRTKNTPETLALWIRWMNDPEIRKYMFPDLAQEPEAVARWLDMATTDPKRHYFDIRADGKTIGFVSIRQDKRPANSGEVGIIIGEQEYQGKRIGTQALSQVLETAQTIPKLELLRAHIKPDNFRSRRLFESAGFTMIEPVTINGVRMMRYYLHLP